MIMNKINLMGNICKDLELRKAGETSVVKFNIAVKRRMAKEGQQQTDFISCVAFGKTAEFLSSYFKKGQQVAISGRIQTGSYDKDGQKVYTTDVIVEEVYFCGSKGESKQTDIEEATDDLPF